MCSSSRIYVHLSHPVCFTTLKTQHKRYWSQSGLHHSAVKPLWKGLTNVWASATLHLCACRRSHLIDIEPTNSWENAARFQVKNNNTHCIQEGPSSYSRHLSHRGIHSWKWLGWIVVGRRLSSWCDHCLILEGLFIQWDRPHCPTLWILIVALSFLSISPNSLLHLTQPGLSNQHTRPQRRRACTCSSEVRVYIAAPTSPAAMKITVASVPPAWQWHVAISPSLRWQEMAFPHYSLPWLLKPDPAVMNGASRTVLCVQANLCSCWKKILHGEL